MFYKKGVLRNFTKFTGKHLCQSLFLSLQSLFFNPFPRPATWLKKRLWLRCFPVDFVKFLRTPFLTEHLWTTASISILPRDSHAISDKKHVLKFTSKNSKLLKKVLVFQTLICEISSLYLWKERRRMLKKGQDMILLHYLQHNEY